MDLKVAEESFIDELRKIASELTPEARSHVAKKNFAVSAKTSNTGRAAYPIPDASHARAALGFAAMHHDKKDLAEVRKDVERKFPGMVHKKAAVLSSADYELQRSFLPEVREHAAWAQKHPIQSRLGGAAMLGVPGAVLGSPFGLPGAAIGGGIGALAGGMLASADRKQQNVRDMERDIAHTEAHHSKKKEKKAFTNAVIDQLKEAGILQRLASEAGTHKAELAGLATLAAPAVDEAQAHARAALAGDYNKGGVRKREVLPHAAKPLIELGGLGVLAGPSIAHLAGHH